MLTAVKSLRLVVGRGATLYGVVVILVRVWMGGASSEGAELGLSAIGGRVRRGACWEMSCGTPLPLWGLWGGGVGWDGLWKFGNFDFNSRIFCFYWISGRLRESKSAWGFFESTFN